MNEVIQLFNFTTHKYENVCHGFEIHPKKNNKKFCQDKSSNLHIWKTKILPM